MVDVSRDPRWGRVVEGFGEDVHLTAVMGRRWCAAIRAPISRPRHDRGDREALRRLRAARGRPRLQHGRCLGAPPAQRLPRAVPRGRATRASASVMASFNTVAGVPMHANRALLTDVLKTEWGFDGVVVGDADGVANLLPHGVAETSRTPCARRTPRGWTSRWAARPPRLGSGCAPIASIRRGSTTRWRRVLGTEGGARPVRRARTSTRPTSGSSRPTERPRAGAPRRRPLGGAAEERRHAAARDGRPRAAHRPLRDLHRSPRRLDAGVLGRSTSIADELFVRGPTSRSSSRRACRSSASAPTMSTRSPRRPWRATSSSCASASPARCRARPLRAATCDCPAGRRSSSGRSPGPASRSSSSWRTAGRSSSRTGSTTRPPSSRSGTAAPRRPRRSSICCSAIRSRPGACRCRSPAPRDRCRSTTRTRTPADRRPCAAR